MPYYDEDTALRLLSLLREDLKNLTEKVESLENRVAELEADG